MTFLSLMDRCATGDRNLFLLLTPSSPTRAGRVWNVVFSRLADGPLYVGIALTALLLNAPHAEAFVLCLALGFAFELPSYKGIKHCCRRPRPCHADLDRINLLPVPDLYSFPSGHTAGAFVLAGTVAGFYPMLSLPAYLFSVCVGYSRVYNRLHFPADILVGAVLGSLCAGAARLVVSLLNGGAQ